MTPLIGVTSDLREFDPYKWHCIPSPYIDAITDVAAGMPVIIPALGNKLDPDALVDRLDGLLVTGSRSNVHPSNYDTEVTGDHLPFDPARDHTTLPLIRKAIERGLPVLAICRGIQELNVALGGSITAAFQKNRRLNGHEYPWRGTLDERFGLAHEISVKPGSCLASIIGEEPVKVNSLHTQALDKLGHNVEIEATAPDGTIEAISVKDAPGFVVGVQWHPEYWATSDKPSGQLFKAFSTAAHNWQQDRFSSAMAAE